MTRPESVPVICVAEPSVTALALFNPNQWPPLSKGVVQSCATELSVINHISDHLKALCLNAPDLCQPSIRNLQRQWGTAPWDLDRGQYFVQVPALHVYIEGLFGSIKSLLDLSVQLLSKEGIVKAGLDGFHEVKGVYGGNVINALTRNANAAKKEVVARVNSLLIKHKDQWIDEVIEARHLLVHPPQGASQVMFHLKLGKSGDQLAVEAINLPRVANETIDVYAAARTAGVHSFCNEFVAAIREAA